MPRHTRRARAGVFALLQQLRNRPLSPLVPVPDLWPLLHGHRHAGLLECLPRAVDQSLNWTYEDYAALDFAPERVFPAGGLYREGIVGYPSPDEVREFARQVRARGSRGASVWSYEHMSEEMWQAVASAAVGEEEEEMSSAEFDQLSASVSKLSGRVGQLEAAVAAIRSAPPPVAAPPGPTYTVQPGDTLSGIAVASASMGQRLYEVNAGVIGGDPNRIYPGQVLVIP